MTKARSAQEILADPKASERDRQRARAALVVAELVLDLLETPSGRLARVPSRKEAVN